jgi:hypothetical protein
MPLDRDLALAALLESARTRTKPRLTALQAKIGPGAATLPERLDTLAALVLELLPVAFGEALSPLPNLDRSAVIGRAVTVIRGMADLLLAAHSGTVSNELNPHGRHFQLAFSEFFSCMHTAMVDAGVPEKHIGNVFQRLAGRLAGWEAKLEAATRGVPDQDLATVANPFLPDSGSEN